MTDPKKTASKQHGIFHLSKWFLDITTDHGEAFIFYSAKLRWHGLEVPYTSLLFYDPKEGLTEKSRFRNIQMPKIQKDRITWKDKKFEVEGTWDALAPPLKARLFEEEDGFLDWHCYQPVSRVKVKVKDKVFEGMGYAEQLILTTTPWSIPMDELRWGRYNSAKDHMVWIELRKEGDNRYWLWHNGNKIKKFSIEDDRIFLPAEKISLKLDQRVVLESDKKIFSVVKRLLDFLPGFNKIIPHNFLMAQETKWLSKGLLHTENQTTNSGMAIHELVDFKV